MIEFGRGLRERRLHRPGTFLLFATPTLVDETRAPDGGHTIKILSLAPYECPEDLGEWDTGKDILAAEHFAALRDCAPNLAAHSDRFPDGPPIACPFRVSIRREPPPTQVARSPAGPGGTPQSSFSTTWG